MKRSVLVLLAILLVGCSKKNVNMESYNDIRPGMTRAQVERILGDEGDEAVDLKTAETFTMYQDGEFAILVTYKADTVSKKTYMTDVRVGS